MYLSYLRPGTEMWDGVGITGFYVLAHSCWEIGVDSDYKYTELNIIYCVYGWETSYNP